MNGQRLTNSSSLAPVVRGGASPRTAEGAERGGEVRARKPTVTTSCC